jgi:hypothetical protein
VPEAVESLCEEAGGGSGVFEVEAVGVEFGEGGGCDYDAWRVFGLDDVEGEVQGFAEDLTLSSDMISLVGIGNLGGYCY